MTTLVVTTREDKEHTIEARDEESVMQNIRDSGLDELLALCGGCLSCATCHVYVDAAWVDRLPAMTKDERDLLDSSGNRIERSRLSCQLPVGPDLNGLRVTIAPEG